MIGHPKFVGQWRRSPGDEVIPYEELAAGKTDRFVGRVISCDSDSANSGNELLWMDHAVA